MGADSFPGFDSIGIEVKDNFIEIVLIQVVVPKEYNSIGGWVSKREVQKHFGCRFKLVADRVLLVAKDIKLFKGKL